MKKIIVMCLGLLFLAAAPALAQKFGYCNSVTLLSQLPEVKQADSDLQSFQTQLTKKGQQMVKDLQEKYDALEQKKNRGEIAEKDYNAQAEILVAEQRKIQDYEEEVYSKLTEKRTTLYKPILEKLNNAMKAVATENGFAYVFDASTQVLLYADESLNVTDLVKTKLGIATK